MTPSDPLNRRQFLAGTAAGLALSARARAEAGAHVFQVDFAQAKGRTRPLHGINKGPLAPGGLLDLTEPQRALGVPYIRLHDCHWPNPDVVDIHAVFPKPAADPERPESYDFRLTDEYLAATVATGAEIIYRLGESIEHTAHKRFVHPPADPAHWARVALGIIRHYNEGWAKGFRYGIRYWEIWNEPENRPAMWTGTDADYFRLYCESARAIKAEFPALKVGGPAVGNTGELMGDRLQPSAFVTAFLRFCRAESLPLDFLSWHCYTADPQELVRRAREVRRLLDDTGFSRAESHLNEWNYLPGGSWTGATRGATPAERQRFYEQMTGPPGAAFLVAALLELQEAPVDVGCLFHGEAGAFGLFSEHGVPQKSYEAVHAFNQLARLDRRVTAHGAVPGRLAMGAGLGRDAKEAVVLVSNFAHPHGQLRIELKNLPWEGGTLYSLEHGPKSEGNPAAREGTPLAPGEAVTLPLAAPAIALLRLRPRP